MSRQQPLPQDSSVKVDGSNNGFINTGSIGSVTVNNFNVANLAPLSSYLTDIITDLSTSVSSQALQPRNKEIPPNIVTKLSANDLARNMSLIENYRSFGYMLEAVYEGIESQNPNARFFVHQRMNREYCLIRDGLRSETDGAISLPQFVRKNSDSIVDRLGAKIMTDFQYAGRLGTKLEVAIFAVGLLIADSIMDCKVLERPANATTS